MALNPVRILGDIIVGIVKLLLAWGRMERMMMPIVGLGYLLGFREDEEDDGAYCGLGLSFGLQGG